MNLRKVFIFFFILLPQIHFAQQNNERKNNFFIEANYHYGFLFPHHEIIEYAVEDHLHGFELSISRPTLGNTIHDELFRYPELGIGSYFGSLSNNEVFGHAIAVYPFVNIPLVRKPRFLFSYKFNFGISYLTKIFDLYENNLNTAIGTHLNVYFFLGLESKVKLAKNLELVNGIGFRHISNGRMFAPNLGLNSVTTKAGLAYYMGNEKPIPNKSDAVNFKKRNVFLIMYGAGIKSRIHFDKRTYFISSLTGEYNRVLSPKRKIGLGVDLFYDRSIGTELEKMTADVKWNNLYKCGIHGSHELVYNKLSFMIQVGTYFLYTYRDVSNLYTRLGFRYNVYKNFYLQSSLKSHRAKADFIEWGIGYGF